MFVLHEALEPSRIFELEDELVVPLRLADEPAGSYAALCICDSIEEVLERQVHLMCRRIVLDLARVDAAHHVNLHAIAQAARVCHCTRDHRGCRVTAAKGGEHFR